MKRVLVAVFAIVGILFAVSCSKDNAEDTLLTLSKKSITFSSNGGEKSITVTTNVEWKTTAPSWIEVKKEEKKLILKVGENKTLEELNGEIKVKAGNLVEVVKVLQQAMTAKVEITPKKLEVESSKGTATVKVVANIATWTATTNADWLKVTAKPKSNELIVEYEQNTTESERTATIAVTIGKTNEIIEVKQKVKTGAYLLPYLNFSKFTLEEIDKFETARGNKAGDKYAGGIIYKTKNKLFNEIAYIVKGQDSPSSYLLAVDAVSMQQNLEKFKSYLKSKGYSKTEEENIYINKEKTLTARIIIKKEDKLAGVAFFPKNTNDNGGNQNDAETFRVFPWIAELPWGATVQQVKDYEKANGGTLKKDFPLKQKDYDSYWYNVTTKDNTTPYTRYYTIGHDNSSTFNVGLIYKEMTFKKTELFYTKSGNGYVLSKKFLALAEKEGFTHTGVTPEDKFDKYENKFKNALMWTKIGTLKGEKTPTVVLQIQRGDTKKKNTAASYTNNSYFDTNRFKIKKVEVKTKVQRLISFLK